METCANVVQKSRGVWGSYIAIFTIFRANSRLKRLRIEVYSTRKGFAHGRGDFTPSYQIGSDSVLVSPTDAEISQRSGEISPPKCLFSVCSFSCSGEISPFPGTITYKHVAFRPRTRRFNLARVLFVGYSGRY